MGIYNWEKIEKYNSYIKHVFYKSKTNGIPEVSVVVISNKSVEEIRDTINSLLNQSEISYEIIIVDNGMPKPADEFLGSVDKLIALSEDTGAYIARNIGARFATGRLLMFVDDDGIPEDEYYLCKFRDCFDKYQVVAVRGVCKVTKGIDPPFYNLGEYPFPAYPTLEGCCAFLKSAFMEVGGWNDDIKFGAGGFEISVQLINAGYPYRSMMYSPDPVLIHNYALDNNALSEKQKRQEQGRQVMRELHPNWKAVMTKWTEIHGQTNLLLKQGEIVIDDIPPDVDEKKISFKQALAEYPIRFDNNMFTIFAPERIILKIMSDIGFVAYYRSINIPKVIEFRRNDENVVMEVRSRRC